MEVLHLPTYEYNLARMFTVMNSLVRKNGGRIAEASRYKADIFKSMADNKYVVNRSIDERINVVEAAIDRDRRFGVIHEAQIGVLRQLQKIDNSPQCVTNLTSLGFVLNGVYYSIATLSTNAFCNNIIYGKTPVRSGDKVHDVYHERLCDEWPRGLLIDEYQTKLAELDSTAQYLYDKLMEAPFSTIFSVEEVTVPNTYDGGYHIERVKRTMNLFYR